MVNTLRITHGDNNEDEATLNLKARISASLANVLPNLANKWTNYIVNDIRTEIGSCVGEIRNVRGVPTSGIYEWIERFDKLNPVTFSSVTTITGAEDWIYHMEKILGVLGCADKFKTGWATFKLEGEALHWWSTFKKNSGGETFMAACDWTTFREAFFFTRGFFHKQDDKDMSESTSPFYN